MTLGNELLTVGVREARTNLRSLVEQVGDGTPARIMVHNRPVAVLLRSDEADRWERIYLGLAALHGLEIYPELAAGDTSKVAKMVRGEVRATDADLRRLARSRSEILRAAEYVGLATVRVKFASMLDEAIRGRPLMIVSYGQPRALLVSFNEYRRLMDLAMVVRWFGAAGLDLANAQPDAVVAWVAAFREGRVAAADEAMGA
jgi:prevent-host-death family protein